MCGVCIWICVPSIHPITPRNPAFASNSEAQVRISATVYHLMILGDNLAIALTTLLKQNHNVDFDTPNCSAMDQKN